MSSFRGFLFKASILAVVATVASSPIVLGTKMSIASAGYGVAYYISPPLVQNSYVTTGAVLETFDSGTNDTSCIGTVPIGVISGTCSFSNGFLYGGATTQSSSPVAGGTSTMYATGGGSSPAISFTFSGARRYLGFWWSAGSPTNTVKFFNGSDEVLSLTTADLITLLGSSLGTFGSTGSVTALNGLTYLKHQYFGHPRGHTQTSPVARSSVTNSEPFTYLHVFASGGLTFDKVTFSGAGFEFDNLVVSDIAQTPATNLVTVGSITGTMPASAKVVTYNSNTGTGTMDNQVASASEPLSPNSFTKAGYTFAGWHTTISGTGGTSYVNQETFNFASDITLFAQWTPNNLVVTHDTQNGTTIANGSTTTGASITTSPGTPTRTGYTFAGWFTTATGGTALTFPYPHTRTADFTLFAQWTPIPVVTTSTTTTIAAATTTTTTLPIAATTMPSTSPTLQAPRTAVVGEPISVMARGFRAGEKVVLRIGGGKTTTLIANERGEVRLDLVLDSDSRGTQQVVASAVSGGRSVKSEIRVTAPQVLPTSGSNTAPLVMGASSIALLGYALLKRRRIFLR